MISLYHSYSERSRRHLLIIDLKLCLRLLTGSQEVKDNAGPSWYGLPRTDPATKKDLQILKMRDVLAMGKQHFKKDNRKNPMPEFSQVGTLVEGPTEFYSARLTKKERKRTLVEEVLSSGQALSKFKSKYNEIQERKTSGKKSHYKKVVARRRRQQG
jgi:hypothetical protein